MHYPSYKALCVDPAVQAEFLTVLADQLAVIAEPHKRLEALAAIDIGGAPFTVAKYLSTLDSASADWDHDGQEARAGRFVAAAKRMARIHPHLDVPTFVFGFDELPGANLPTPALGSAALLAPKEPYDVKAETPAANSARRMRAA